MSLFTDLSPILVPIIALLIPIASIAAWAIVKITRLNLLHETVRHLSANGQSIPPELLAKIVDRKSS
jgi:hypothetical protein